MACQGQNAHPPLYEGLSGALAHNGLSIHQADKQIGRGLCPIFPGGARGINPAMSIGTRTVWDRLARLDPLLATEGYNACEGYRSREELGTLASAEAGFSPAAGERVLDLGCGWGKMTRSLAASGALPLGLDISTEMLRNCRRHSGVDQLVCAQADRLPLRSDAFDKVWSHSMLMHLSRQQVALVIAEVARVLRPGGAACLHFKNRRHPSELLLALRAAWTGGSRHPQRRRGVDPGWLARTARQHFGEVRLVAESFQLLPLSIPNLPSDKGDLGSLGIPPSHQVSFRHLLSEQRSAQARRLFDWLRDRANTSWPFLQEFAKELLLVVKNPRS